MRVWVNEGGGGDGGGGGGGGEGDKMKERILEREENGACAASCVMISSVVRSLPKH
jgi:hypothetical protein